MATSFCFIIYYLFNPLLIESSLFLVLDSGGVSTIVLQILDPVNEFYLIFFLMFFLADHLKKSMYQFSNSCLIIGKNFCDEVNVVFML